MFEGFSNNYTRNVATGTLMSIFVALWSLLFIIPGIIKGLAYSMIFFILRDHPELSALDAITESSIASLTVLGAVFLIAGSISSVLINLYVTPYYMTSVAAFYEKYAKLSKDESYSHAG